LIITAVFSCLSTWSTSSTLNHCLISCQRAKKYNSTSCLF
jgi:hypothetical protein